MKVVGLSALGTGRLYPPGNIPSIHFSEKLSRPQGHSESNPQPSGCANACPHHQRKVAYLWTVLSLTWCWHRPTKHTANRKLQIRNVWDTKPCTLAHHYVSGDLVASIFRTVVPDYVELIYRLHIKQSN
jgi:hypothetical protein